MIVDKNSPGPVPKPTMYPMVRWYDPGQLARTAIDVVISTLFGRHSDYRLTEVLLSPSDEGVIWDDDPIDPAEEHDGIYDYSDRDDLWIDYIADTGSGWNPTYTVAYYATQPTLEFKTRQLDGNIETDKTVRGEILIFGGDQVYPVASRKSYRERLKEPFQAALRRTDPPHPRVFAMPGNHDWYDSLVSFTRLFCSRRWFAGWKTRQKRSYFALKLPHHWWLVGTDVQLDSDIDIPQVQYFRDVARKMEDADRIILCTAEPHWVYAGMYEQFDPEINEDNLQFLEKKVFEKKIAVFLSGDLHHYRRHQNDQRVQKITAGGGGAHAFPTHGQKDVNELAGGFHLQQPTFPPEDESKKLTWQNLGFLFLNPAFGMLTGILYLLSAWSVRADIGGFGIGQTWPAIKTSIATALNNPAAMFWILFVWGGFLMFTDTHSKNYRIIAGSLHGLTHLVCIFLIGWGATYFGVTCLGFVFKQPKQLILAGVIILILGGIVGPTVMGLYLLISLNVFHRHHDEAFSSLRIQDWKNFLRLHIDDAGRLTIFPIGIKRVARHWAPRSSGTGAEFVPRDERATAPELIERKITI
ncbi:MAG: metallophosphoesterase [bacterium]